MSFKKELFTNALAFIKFLEDGKEYFGEVFVTDSSSRLWKIKVRYDDNRKRYLKFEIKAGGKQKFRASADNYKPSKYVRDISKKQNEKSVKMIKLYFCTAGHEFCTGIHHI